jgi:hypothetical protein
VLGGGYQVSPLAGILALVNRNYPSSSTTWTVAANNVTGNGTAWSIQAYAICAP